jgi:AmmeMemoRadiSam system protein B
MLVYGVISPHPPIILPEIGGDETKKVQKAIAALEKAARELALAKPDKLIIISPHPQHGFQVPLYYLGQNLKPDIEIEEILVTDSSYSYYSDLGRKNQEKIQNSRERVAIIASGDMSHVLKAGGPYGFNPAGPKLDKIIIDSIKNKDIDSLLNIDEQVLNQGAECGLRSFLFLLGAFESTPHKPEILSYEGPFGVGYLVTVLRPEAEK